MRSINFLLTSFCLIHIAPQGHINSSNIVQKPSDTRYRALSRHAHNPLPALRYINLRFTFHFITLHYCAVTSLPKFTFTVHTDQLLNYPKMRKNIHNIRTLLKCNQLFSAGIQKNPPMNFLSYNTNKQTEKRR